MRNILLTIIFCYFYSTSAIAEISEKDVGTFAVVGKDQKLTKVYYRLSIKDGKWLMEGKINNKSWQNISCEKECEYYPLSKTKSISYLPKSMVDSYDISCIQNIAQAFCRYALKSNETQGGYVVIALITDTPIPVFLKRVQFK